MCSGSRCNGVHPMTKWEKNVRNTVEMVEVLEWALEPSMDMHDDEEDPEGSALWPMRTTAEAILTGSFTLGKDQFEDLIYRLETQANAMSRYAENKKEAAEFRGCTAVAKKLRAMYPQWKKLS
jgi:hypothetical protein